MLLSLAIKLLGMLPGFTAFGEKVVDHLNRKADVALERYKAGVGADVTTNQGVLSAYVEASKAAAAARAADRGSWSTFWMLPFGAFLPSALHYWAIVLDSLPLLGHEPGTWKIAKLPGVYEGLEVQLMLGAAGIASATTLASLAIRRFAK